MPVSGLSSGKTVGVKCSDDTTTSLPSVAFSGADQLNQRSVNSLEAKSFQKLLPVTDDGFAGRATSSKANENRTVVQLLQNALVQRKAIKQTRPRARVVNGKQRNHCNTISQQSMLPIVLLYSFNICSMKLQAVFAGSKQWS
jgi:hypothetical protein